jgi:hypothetical protein
VSQPAEPSVERLAPGSAVRVRPGTRDPDFPDVVLDGWTGVVTEVDAAQTPLLCQVEWDAATRPKISDAVRERAAREGLEVESMWLGADDLEPARAETPAPAPTDPRTRRVRLALGLAPDGPMPPVTRDALRDYHRHLSARLSFPLDGLFRLQVSASEAKAFPLTLTGLRPADETGRYGILAETRLEGQPCALPLADCAVSADGAARELLEDHAAWYRASPHDPEPAGQEEEALETAPPQPVRRADVLRLAGRVGAVAACAGGPLGAMLAAVGGAQTALVVGAVVLGLGGFLLGGRTALVARKAGRASIPSTLAGLIGACAGALAGAVLGVLVVSFVGTILGAIAGSLVGYVLARLGVKPLGEIGWAVLGALVGGAVLAALTDSERAWEGALFGALVGGGGAILVFVLLLLALAAGQTRE